eukprot:CFRG0373T1
MADTRTPVLLTDEIIKGIKIAKVYEHSGVKTKYNSIGFSRNGERLVTASDDSTIKLYNCLDENDSNNPAKLVNAKKYGINHVMFGHAENTVLHASTKASGPDDSVGTLRYLSLHDNKYIRFFAGHTSSVTSMELAPDADFFLSTSMDKSMRMWDIRTENSVGRLFVHEGVPVVAYDPTGVCFAVGINPGLIKMYSSKNDTAPFTTFNVEEHLKSSEIIGLQFSPDGGTLLITTSISSLVVIDAFEGMLIRTYNGFQNDCQGGASFSPDGNYICSGSDNGLIHIWETKNGNKVAQLEGYEGPCKLAKFNPVFLQLASAADHLTIWHNSDCSDK